MNECVCGGGGGVVMLLQKCSGLPHCVDDGHCTNPFIIISSSSSRALSLSSSSSSAAAAAVIIVVAVIVVVVVALEVAVEVVMVMDFAQSECGSDVKDTKVERKQMGQQDSAKGSTCYSYH